MKRIILIFALAVLVFIGLSERVLSQPARIWSRQFRASRPAPYTNAAYFSQAFVDEMFSTERAWRLTDAGYWTLDDFKGQWINFRNGARVTTGQPAHAKHTLYMLGNSTTLDLEVPDNLTIASQLQALIGERYKVVNLGATAPTAQTELFRLKTLPLVPGDIVLFYDGVTEAVSIYTSAANRMEPSGICQTARDYFSHLALVRWLCPLPYETIPPDIADNEKLTAAVTAQAAIYRRVLSEAAVYATSHGATFIHILQPHLYTRPLSAYEQMLDRQVIEPGSRQVFEAAWPVLQKAANEAGVINIDLTHAYDNLRASGQEIYLDYCHVNDIANGVMAHAMFNVLFPIF